MGGWLGLVEWGWDGDGDGMGMCVYWQIGGGGNDA